MEQEKITKNTKLSYFLKQNKDFVDQLVKINPQAKMLKNPIVRTMLGNLTIHDLCQQAKIDDNLFIKQINQAIEKIKK